MGLAGHEAEEGEAVRSCGTEAGPGFELWRVGDLGEEAGGDVAEMRDVGGVDGLVEAGVFDGGSDDGAGGVGAGGAGDDIDARRADDAAGAGAREEERRRASGLFWARRGGGAGERWRRPRSRCSRQTVRRGGCRRRCGPRRRSPSERAERTRRLGAEVDGGGADGGEQGGGELARVEAVLLDELKAVIAGGELREGCGERSSGLRMPACVG